MNLIKAGLKFVFIGINLLASPKIKQEEQNRNFVTTSHIYDDSSDSPFRLEKLTVYEKNEHINVLIDYYINTKSQTFLKAKANNIDKKEILTKIMSSGKYRQLKILVPSKEENAILDLHFSMQWSQIFTMSARIYLNVETKKTTQLEKGGNFKYRVVTKTIFNNQTKKFAYFYDDINFSIKALKEYLYFSKKQLIEVSSHSNVETSSKLINLDTDETIAFNIINKKLATVLKPGHYQIKWVVNYRKGLLWRNLHFSFDFKILKNYFGSCENSYYCLTKGEINGVLKIIKKENFLV